MMGIPDSTHDALTAALFEAAVAPEHWPAALSLFAEAFNCDSASFTLWSEGYGSPSYSEVIGPLAPVKGRYAEHYCRIDPHLPAIARHPTGRWMAFPQFDEAYVGKSEYFVDFLLPRGIRYGAGLRVANESSRYTPVVGLSRGRDARPFSGRELRGLDRLPRSLERAFALMKGARRRHFENRVATALFEQVSFGVFIADAAGCVLAMNGAAELIIAADDGLVLDAGALIPARSFERSKLSRALAHPVEGSGKKSDAFLVGRPSGRLPYSVFVMSMPADLHPIQFGVVRAAMILVAYIDARTEIHAGMLGDLFGFTGT